MSLLNVTGGADACPPNAAGEEAAATTSVRTARCINTSPCQEWKTRNGRRPRPAAQIRMHVGKVLIRHDLDSIRRHVAARRAHVAAEPGERQRIRRDARTRRAALPLVVVTLITAVLDEQRLASGGVPARR